MKNYIQYPLSGGTASRQAHADLPPGTYEREMGKEGFFGPASFFYHRHPPTGWSHFEGPLRPHAFDLLKLGRGTGSPWEAPVVLGNAHTQLRYWETSGHMPQLVRNADGDQLLFVHRAPATCTAILAIWPTPAVTSWCCRVARCGGWSAASPRGC